MKHDLDAKDSCPGASDYLQGDTVSASTRAKVTCCARDRPRSYAIDADLEVSPFQSKAASQAVYSCLHCSQSTGRNCQPF